MYDNTGKIFWISFLTSFFVSLIIVFIMIIFVIPSIPFMNQEKELVEKTEIPLIEGVNVEKAKIIALNKDLNLFVESEKITGDVPKNVVISQTPIAGTKVEKNSVIYVVVSAGKEIKEEIVEEKKEIKKVVLPHYVGLNIDDVQRDIIRFNLKVGSVEYVENDKYSPDVVIKTLPQSGTEIAEGSEINIFVSKGAGDVVVPDVYRLTKNAAINKIKNAGLYVEETLYTTHERYAFDIIIKQEPKAGSKVKKGTGVKIWINSEMR